MSTRIKKHHHSNNMKVLHGKINHSPNAQLQIVKELINNEPKTSLFKTFIEKTSSVDLEKTRIAEILDVNVRTINRYIENKHSFDNNKTEKMIYLIKLIDKGIQVFEDSDKFKNWLHVDNVALSKKPADLLSTITGIQIIDDCLTRIEYGVFA